MFLSVIVPVYNNEKYLCRCLKSLIPLIKAEDIEILLIDDGSRDESGKICDDFADKNKNVRVFHTGNKGVSLARNFGIEKSEAKYITFVDSDDYVDSDCLLDIVRKIKKRNLDLIFTRMSYKKKDQTQAIPFKHSSFCNDFINYPVYMHSPCNKIINRNLLISNHISFDVNFKVCEDLLFSFETVICSKNYDFFDDTTYFYCINGDSSTHKIDPTLAVQNEWSAYLKLKQICEAYKITKDYQYYLDFKKLNAEMLYLTDIRIFSPKKYRELNSSKDYWRYTPSKVYKITSICANKHIDVVPFLLGIMRFFRNKNNS